MTTDLEELDALAVNYHGDRLGEKRGSKISAFHFSRHPSISARQACSASGKRQVISLPHISIQDDGHE